jgi:flagella basal body P-ring formation protein FlgA
MNKGFLTALGLIAVLVMAPDGALGDVSKPQIVVGRTAKVRGAQITLGEIGQISTDDHEAAQLTSKLRSLVIAESPLPGGSVQLMGQRIVDAISAAQIDLGSVLFSIPPVIFVQREGRTLNADEVLASAQQCMGGSEIRSEIKLKSVQWEQEQLIPIGQTSITVESLGEPAAGKLPLRVSVTVDNAAATKFLATATVDDWRAIPVLNKTIERGMLIAEGDYELVRFNLSELPSDVASSPQQVVGRAAKSRIPAGESVRRSMIDIPPTIAKGTKINARYAVGGLMVTVSAVAVDDGLKGEIIRLRNEASNKIFKGSVIDEKTVEVK